jgi:hypothetical protein
MSVYLEAVAQARETRDQTHQASNAANLAFRAALERAHQHHSLRQIAVVAGISHSGVKFLIDEGKDNDDVGA